MYDIKNSVIIKPKLIQYKDMCSMVLLSPLGSHCVWETQVPVVISTDSPLVYWQ